MVKLILENINNVDINKLKDSFSILPKYRQETIISYQNENDKNLSLLAGYLLHQEIGELDKSIVFNKHGKGYIKDRDDLFFSLSHSKDFVLLAISDHEVGCDIEYMKEPNLDIAKRFFVKEEYDSILASKNQKETFYKYWTIKEAYLKCVGVGLSKPLNSIAMVDRHLSDETTYIYKSEPFNDYYISVVVKY